jgi:hypothetical protein
VRVVERGRIGERGGADLFAGTAPFAEDAWAELRLCLFRNGTRGVLSGESRVDSHCLFGWQGVCFLLWGEPGRRLVLGVWVSFCKRKIGLGGVGTVFFQNGTRGVLSGESRVDSH